MINLVDRNSQRQSVDIPEDIGLSLMEVLKAMEYPIAATCGGLALCATCHVEVLKGIAQLPEPGEAKMQMIDMLPDAVPGSRLACKQRISAIMEGMVFRIMPEP